MLTLLDGFPFTAPSPTFSTYGCNTSHYKKQETQYHPVTVEISVMQSNVSTDTRVNQSEGPNNWLSSLHVWDVSVRLASHNLAQ
jgi:hypothetical protein